MWNPRIGCLGVGLVPLLRGFKRKAMRMKTDTPVLISYRNIAGRVGEKRAIFC